MANRDSSSPELSSPPSETISHPPTPQPIQRNTNNNNHHHAPPPPSSTQHHHHYHHPVSHHHHHQQHQQHQQHQHNPYHNDPKLAESTIRVGSLVSEGVESNHNHYSVSASATSNNAAAAHRIPRHTSEPPAAGETKIKRPRKKRESKIDDAERKPRKPRGSGATNPRKKQKTEEVKQESVQPDSRIDVPSARQPKMTELIASDTTPTLRASYLTETGNNEVANLSQSSTHNQYSPPQPPVPPQAPPQRPSGHHYDPIRSTTISTPQQSTAHTSYSPTTATGPPPASFRPSASPAISSIIDPPAAPHSREPPNNQHERMRNSIGSPSNAHIILNPTPSPVLAQSSGLGQSMVSPTQRSAPSRPNVSEAAPPPAENDSNATRPQKPAAVIKGTSSGPASTAPSPKPSRAKDQPSELPQGSGLISSALFGGEGSGGASGEAPTIVLEIPLRGKSNQIVNFARMVEDKYGFAALHPRLAARKERLAQVAAAGAALEKSTNGKLGLSPTGESGDDDMSVDIDRDSDNDGDVAMSGVNGHGTAGNSGAEGEKKRRRRKMEEYDRDDPFVDDSEMAWEAQAAASKDGFFVYCGPLVPEGEKPAIERYAIAPPFSIPLC